ncbi:TPA: hypothetical protein ACQFK6_001486 [Proteus mirabilis]|nr:hypothetical protein [Proteus mirabilis]
MSIKLMHKKVERLELRALSKGEIEQKKEVHINIGSTIYAHSTDKKMVRINYPVSLSIKDNVHISISYDFYFSSSEEITEEFNNSEVARKDAPALAYPYIKSYIEGVLTMSGYKDFEIPFIDFAEDPFEFN